MPDREKVIKDLEECLSASCRGFRPRESCPYNDDEWDIMRDALALLKEQEAVVPLTIDDAVSEIMDKHYKRLKEQEAMLVEYSVFDGMKYGGCPRCNARIDNLVNPKACGYCGQAVKWE